MQKKKNLIFRVASLLWDIIQTLKLCVAICKSIFSWWINLYQVFLSCCRQSDPELKYLILVVAFILAFLWKYHFTRFMNEEVSYLVTGERKLIGFIFIFFFI